MSLADAVKADRGPLCRRYGRSPRAASRSRRARRVSRRRCRCCSRSPRARAGWPPTRRAAAFSSSRSNKITPGNALVAAGADQPDAERAAARPRRRIMRSNSSPPCAREMKVEAQRERDRGLPKTRLLERRRVDAARLTGPLCCLNVLRSFHRGSDGHAHRQAARIAAVHRRPPEGGRHQPRASTRCARRSTSNRSRACTG